MIGRISRVVLVTLLVLAMAGAAAAFSLGVDFVPHSNAASSCQTGYGGNCHKRHHHKKHCVKHHGKHKGVCHKKHHHP